MKNTIVLWLKALIENKSLPIYLVDDGFIMEDGMSLVEYWDYEKNSFQNFSKIFDLDTNFSIEIINSEILKKGKMLVWFYLFNKKKKIVFKMSITIKDDYISSNNFITQIVAKYRLNNEKLDSLGLAIKSAKEIVSIVSPDLELLDFSKGANFIEDGFYSAKFSTKDFSFNQKYSFFIKFKNDTVLEKRTIFFDKLRFQDKPYEINGNKLKIIDENYPVNLAIFKKNGASENYVYPRRKEIILEDVKQAIVTDVLDNDWIVNFS